jgi:hypothetical protein
MAPASTAIVLSFAPVVQPVTVISGKVRALGVPSPLYLDITFEDAEQTISIF